MTDLHTPRLLLRGLQPHDFAQWSEVRQRCASWLTKWEPEAAVGAPDPSKDPAAFAARCNARDRERQLGTGFAWSMWHRGHFCGEINVNNVARGAFQSGHVGYWVDERWAGQGFIPEALVAVFARERRPGYSRCAHTADTTLPDQEHSTPTPFEVHD